MKKYIYPLALAATMITASACSDDEVVNETPVIPEDQKEMISFSLSDGAANTRAGFLGSATSLAMHIVSEDRTSTAQSPVTPKYTNTVASAAVQALETDYSVVTFGDAYKRYWDDAHGRKSLLSVYAVAVPNGGISIKNNGKTLEQLLAISGQSTTAPWVSAATPSNTIEWQVTTTEQKKDASSVTTPTENIDKEDLVYANNIQANTTLGKNGVYRWSYTDDKYVPDMTGSETTHKNGQMVFYQNAMTDATAAIATITDAPGHFDKGHLMFNHALSRISIKMIAGEGFAKVETGSFVLSSDGVQFLNMNVKGNLNLQTGVWTLDSSSPTGTIVTKPAFKTTKDNGTVTSMYYETVAQMLPDYVFNSTGTDANKNVLKFSIDNNTYFITQSMIHKALKDNASNNGLDASAISYKMNQGKNYVFTITINKKQIEAITATLKAWDDVNAEFAQDNTHITVATLSTVGAEHNDFNLFRFEETLDKIYTDDSYTANTYSGDYKANGVATLVEMKDESDNSYSPKKWSATDWYYKDNMTAYHLRTLNKLAADEPANDSDDDAENVSNTLGTPAKSFFTMKNGTQEAKDYHWGAPMNTNADLKYDLSYGYKNSIHKGFVAPANGVTNPINITELHMMSNINVVLKTTPVSQGNHINLRTGSGTSPDPYVYASVKLTKLSSSATVDMGIGLVTPSTTITNEETMTRPVPASYFVQTTGTTPTEDITTTQKFTWAVVPQILKRDESNIVGITITTPDNNEYYIIEDLSKIKPSSVGSQAGQMHNTTTAIDRWYPNHSYTYTLTLTKKGIEAITCTLAEWVTVEGANTNIDLEN